MFKKENITRLAIYFTTFLIPFYFFRFDISFIKTNIFEVFVLLSLILTFALAAHKKIDKKIATVTVIFLLAALISVFVAGDRVSALGIFKGWFVVPVVYAYTLYRNFDAKSVSRAIIPLYFSLLLVSLWAILQRYGVIHELFYQVGDSSFAAYFLEKRSFGPFESPNYLAMFLVPVTFLSLAMWKCIKDSTLKILFAITLLLPIIALYFSASRGGLIAFLAAIVLFLLFNSYSRNPGKESLIKTVLVIASLLIALFAVKYYLGSRSSHEGGDNIRREIYSYSVTLVKENPVLGIGLGNFQNKIDEISKPNAAFQFYGIPFALHPHNLYLAMWLNLGIVGIISFILLIMYLFKRILSIKDSYIKALLIAAIASILVHGLVDTTYLKNDLSVIFWLMVAFTLIFKQDKPSVVSSRP